MLSAFETWRLQQREGLAEHLDYWKQRLEGAPKGLELPTDRPRPPVQTFAGARYPFVLPQPLFAALETLSQQQEVTLFMTLLAAFQVLLHRYTGQDDLLVGIPIVEYPQAEDAEVIGNFVNFLVLRTSLSGNPSFQELLRRVREVTLEAYAHQHAPFEQLVATLLPERDLSHHPLFQVMFILENASPEALEVRGPTLHSIVGDSSRTQCDLTLYLQDNVQGLRGWVAYSTDLFDATTIARLVGHWQKLLEGVVADPEQPISELPLLTDAEQQLLVEWDATVTAYPKENCIHQLFEAQVECTPDAVAAVYKDAQLTYRELNQRANQLAHYLQKLGVGPEVLVGICAERSLDMVVGLLGILKAGGAYVPLDPTYPSERLAFMLTDAQVPVLVTQEHLTKHLPVHGLKVVCLDAEATVLAQQDKANPPPTGTADNLAYVIYTSGSTGRPKGVQILHRAVVNFLLSMRQQPGLTAEDTLLAVTTLSFDIAALEIFLPLIVGARLIVASRDVVTSGTALAEALDRSHATVMQATPITWRMLLAAGWQGNPRLKILCGGEALPQELARQLLPKAASLWNLYGPTETTIWSTVCKIEPEHELVTVGRPIANTQIYLLDAQLHLVPIGVSGELYIGGDDLARGYLNRPELTAERFIPHPFSDAPGACLYKTGDLARYRADGTIELIGRLDHQVKVHGFRIELGEIEAMLGQHLAVRQAVVMAREDTPGDKHLVAYVVPQPEQILTSSELRRLMQERLPDYMIPTAFVFLETLPQTPNGKVDRRALPAPERTRPKVDTPFIAPTLMVHHQLIQIWEELLDARPIGIQDNFFDLGGYSLLAVCLVDRIEQVWGKKISPEVLLANT
ncbi:MAG TPA: amino acid adenylation domain-containing protein, partial [Ktedonobacteraceae bacterium]|nr:amino acid adenylation domain-containing protein [Ktedonobacteraceae bacterium]